LKKFVKMNKIDMINILKINSKNLPQKVIKEVVEIIKAGGVIVCPTDTVYGLICDAANKRAVERIFKIKKRPKGKPIPIFVKNIKMAKKFVKLNKKQEKFLKNNKITAVLKVKNQAKKVFPGGIISSEDKIGIRIPNYKPINNLFKKLKFPLTGTSANISGKLAPTRIKEVLKQFQKEKIQPDLILDAGNLKPSKPSMVIDLTNKTPKILRLGSVSKKQLKYLIFDT